MKRYPYLRAYMAGVLLPSWFLLVVLVGFVFGRVVSELPAPVEQMIIFPMAAVPNLWGLWNVLYLVLALKRRLLLGVWGALLPLILIPSGLLLQRLLSLSLFTPIEALAAFPLIAAVYYLAWKHIVGFFNRVAGVE